MSGQIVGNFCSTHLVLKNLLDSLLRVEDDESKVGYFAIPTIPLLPVTARLLVNPHLNDLGQVHFEN